MALTTVFNLIPFAKSKKGIPTIKPTVSETEYEQISAARPQSLVGTLLDEWRPLFWIKM